MSTAALIPEDLLSILYPKIRVILSIHQDLQDTRDDWQEKRTANKSICDLKDSSYH